MEDIEKAKKKLMALAIAMRAQIIAFALSPIYLLLSFSEKYRGSWLSFGYLFLFISGIGMIFASFWRLKKTKKEWFDLEKKGQNEKFPWRSDVWVGQILFSLVVITAGVYLVYLGTSVESVLLGCYGAYLCSFGSVLMWESIKTIIQIKKQSPELEI